MRVASAWPAGGGEQHAASRRLLRAERTAFPETGFARFSFWRRLRLDSHHKPQRRRRPEGSAALCEGQGVQPRPSARSPDLRLYTVVISHALFACGDARAAGQRRRWAISHMCKEWESAWGDAASQRVHRGRRATGASRRRKRSSHTSGSCSETGARRRPGVNSLRRWKSSPLRAGGNDDGPLGVLRKEEDSLSIMIRVSQSLELRPSAQLLARPRRNAQARSGALEASKPTRA